MSRTCPKCPINVRYQTNRDQDLPEYFSMSHMSHKCPIITIRDWRRIRLISMSAELSFHLLRIEVCRVCKSDSILQTVQTLCNHCRTTNSLNNLFTRRYFPLSIFRRRPFSLNRATAAASVPLPICILCFRVCFNMSSNE